MEINLKDKVALVFDYRSYFSVAVRLAKDFGTVYYYCPYVINGYPEHSPVDIGRNVPGVTKIKEWAEVIHEVDIVVFCDCHEPYLQNYFRSIGIRVFGSVFACDIEYDRKGTKELLKKLGLPVGTYYTAKGIDALDEILKSGTDLYVKSSLRGDMETWHHTNYALSEREIKRMRHDMGVFENKEQYLVEEKLDTVAEIGYDGFVIDNIFPEITVSGIELKDAGYLGKMIPYKELPKQLTDITDALAPTFSEMGYRGAFSDEVIITKDKRGFPLDFTCRMPQPNTDLAMEMYTNYSEIIWNVASGIVPEIKYKYKYGVQLIIKSDIAETDPSPIIIPDECKDFVKIKSLVVDENGTNWYTPIGVKMREIGSVIGMADSIQGAIKKATEVSESIEGFDTYIKTDCLEKGLEQINNLTKAGIKFM